MEKRIVLTELLSAAATAARKAELYPAGTFVVDLAELREIVAQMLEPEAQDI